MCLLLALTLGLSVLAFSVSGGVGPLVTALVALCGLTAVVAQWGRHPEAAWDFVQGGVVGILQDDSRVLRWLDWEIGMSRWGQVDFKTRRLTIVRRAFFGLIPAGEVDRSLDDFYKASIKTSNDSTVLRLELHANDVKHVLLLDIGHGSENPVVMRLMSSLRERLSGLVEVSRRNESRREVGAGGGLAARIARARTAEGAPARPQPCTLEHEGVADRAAHLRALSQVLPGGKTLRASRSRGRLHAQRHGREVSVSTWVDHTRQPDKDLTRYTLTADSQALLRVTRPADLLEASPSPRAPYEIVASQGAQRLLGSVELEVLLQRLFDDLGCHDLTVEKGTIYAEKPAHAHDLCPQELERLLASLERLAVLLEGEQSGLVTSLTAYEQLRCPYCRDDLDPADGLVACASCGTQHHDECWEDMGRCTIRGCDALRAEPVPRRVRGNTERRPSSGT